MRSISSFAKRKEKKSISHEITQMSYDKWNQLG
jgi:hypothetical protein